MKHLLLLFTLLLLAGCGTQEIRGRLHFHLDPKSPDASIVFPAAPEVPRYRYAGMLTGEDNFRREALSENSRADRLKRGLLWALGSMDDAIDPNPKVLGRPQSGLVDSTGRIYVTDTGRGTVFVFDEFVDELGGRMNIWELARPYERFKSPVGVAEGRTTITVKDAKAVITGEVFVTDADLGVVVRLDRDGQPLGVIGQGILKRPTGIVRDKAQGLIYVADTMAHDIKVFDDEGRLINILGERERGDSAGWLNMPTHLALRGGKLYVSDTMNARIQVLDLDGNLLHSFGQRGLFVGNLVRSKGVAVDDEENIYVIESYYDHLNIYSKDGQLMLSIGGTGDKVGMFFLPAGVWIDNKNRVFVADMFNSRVIVFQFLGGDDG